MDSFEKTKGLGKDELYEETVEWNTIYYCERTVLLSRIRELPEFRTRLQKTIKTKRKLWFKKETVEEIYYYDLDEIRNGPLRAELQKYIYFTFGCEIPNNHIHIVTENDKVQGKKGCMGRIVAERIPRDLFYRKEEAPAKYILVKESQNAVLFRDGKLLVTLPSGRHDIISYSKDFNIIDIWFVDLSNFNLLWGTKSKTSDMDEARANGSFIIRINNPNNLIMNVLGTQYEYWQVDLENYVRDRIRQTVNDAIANRKSFDLYQDTKKFEMDVKVNAKKMMEDVGIELVDFSVRALKFADEIEQAFKERTKKRLEMQMKLDEKSMEQEIELKKLEKLKELGVDVGQYTRDQALKEVAGTGGIGPGFVAAQALAKTPATPAGEKICPKCGKPAGAGNFCQHCGASMAVATGVINCPNCGKPAGRGKFCQHCGSAIIAEIVNCSNCGKPPGTGKFCQHCGAPLQAQPQKKHCTKCGKEYDPDVKFCPDDGTLL